MGVNKMANTHQSEPARDLETNTDAPRYESISDLRLLRKAFRQGWIKNAPDERWDRWIEDVTRGIRGIPGVRDDKLCLTAIRTFLAIQKFLDAEVAKRLEALEQAIIFQGEQRCRAIRGCSANAAT